MTYVFIQFSDKCELLRDRFRTVSFCVLSKQRFLKSKTAVLYIEVIKSISGVNNNYNNIIFLVISLSGGEENACKNRSGT